MIDDAEKMQDVLAEFARLSAENKRLRSELVISEHDCERALKDLKALAEEHDVNLYQWRMAKNATMKTFDWTKIVSNTLGGDNEP